MPRPPATPACPGGAEAEDRALGRAASHCARDGEIVVYLSQTADGQSYGYYPWEANVVIMNTGSMLNPANQTFAHELGHYFGLPHVFPTNQYNGSGAYEMNNPNSKDPIGALKLSDQWDLVYAPADVASTITPAPSTKMSPAVRCETHSCAPVSRSRVRGPWE